MASRIVSTFSVAICLCTAALASNYLQFKKSFESTSSAGARVNMIAHYLNQHDADQDRGLYDTMSRFVTSKGGGGTTQDLERALDVRIALEENGRTVNGQQVRNQIQQIKASPLFQDSDKRSSNWLSAALDHLKNLFHFQLPKGRIEAPQTNISLSARIFKDVFIGLLVLAILSCIYLFLRQFSYKKSLKRKAKAILEEDEPERTADEWLRLADGLTSQGRFREAVRCLYLACLLRLDEADVARFDRGQTNWEHLARIQSSPRRPPSLDFRPPTQAFDLIWYGYRIRGLEDVDRFRVWYSSVVDSLRQGVAA